LAYTKSASSFAGEIFTGSEGNTFLLDAKFMLFQEPLLFMGVLSAMTFLLSYIYWALGYFYFFFRRKVINMQLGYFCP
jgi:hypothetical protein